MIHRLSTGFMVFSFRRFLEACSTDWQAIADVSALARLSDPRCDRQVLGLVEEGFIELEGRCVRLTDSGILEAMRQGPSSTDLLDGVS